MKRKPIGAGDKPSWAGRSRDQRIAFVVGVVSALNSVYCMVLCFGSIFFNFLVQAITGYLPMVLPEHQSKPFPSDWRGHMFWQVPWWMFALSGLILIVVALLSWPPARRFTPSDFFTRSLQRTDPPHLIVTGFVLSAALWYSLAHYDGLLSILSPYWIGPLACWVAVAIAFVRWQCDPRSTTGSKRAEIPSSRAARVVGIVALVNLVAGIAVPLLVVALSQITYIASHAGSLPELPGQGMSLDSISVYRLWAGHLVLDLPWWFFALNAAVMAAVVAFIWPVEVRFSATHRRDVLLNTTPLALAFKALILGVAQLLIVPSFHVSVEEGGYAAGPIICFAVVGLALVVWWWGPGSEERRAA